MKILLIAHWFPPINIIGSVRAFEMARYMTDVGHEVHVIYASETDFSSDYDPPLQNIYCHPVPCSPLIRWLDPSEKNQRFRLCRALVRRLTYPDQYILMQRKYVFHIRALLATGFVPDVIISTALPFSLHCLALKIKKTTKAYWIADNRDLWATSVYRRRSTPFRVLDAVFERRILRHADAILTIGERMAQTLKATLGHGFPVHVIRNGFDLRDPIPCHRNPGAPLRFVYTGILYDYVRDIRPLFKALQLSGHKAKVEFYGSERRVVELYQKEYPEIHTTWYPRTSKAQIKKIQREADFLIVALGKSDFEKGVLTGKFFEYIESRRPIIALCDDDSELANLVRSYNLGLATRDSNTLAEFLDSMTLKDTVPDLDAPPLELSRQYQLRTLETIMTGFYRAV